MAARFVLVVFVAIVTTACDLASSSLPSCGTLCSLGSSPDVSREDVDIGILLQVHPFTPQLNVHKSDAAALDQVNGTSTSDTQGGFGQRWARIMAATQKEETPGAQNKPAQPAQAPPEGAVGKSTTKAPTTTEDPKARLACPYTHVWDENLNEKEKAKCVVGANYGCHTDGRSMWVKQPCAGVFGVQGALTSCGKRLDLNEKPDQNPVVCAPGEMPAAKASCGLMVLTTFFSMKKDWQRNKYIKPSVGKMRILYHSALKSGINITVVYDDLPPDMMSRFRHPRLHFVQVNTSEFDPRFGVNDVRYFYFDKLIRQNPEWRSVFIVDAFDVRSVLNPCGPETAKLDEKKLYIGGERERLRGHPWMSVRFKKMGGKYETWYKGATPDMFILNCGLTGGGREIMLKLIDRMKGVLSDKKLQVRQKSQTDEINLNMAALNWILYNEFKGQFLTGQPYHSSYKKFENKRKDVWFVHK